MTGKDSYPNWEELNEEQLHAFEALKLLLFTPRVLALPTAGNAYLADTNASTYQLVVTSLQLQDDKSFLPVGCWSYSLNGAETNLSAAKRKDYAVVWAVTKLRQHTEGLRSPVRTDQNSCMWLLSLTDFDGLMEIRTLGVHLYDTVPPGACSSGTRRAVEAAPAWILNGDTETY